MNAKQLSRRGLAAWFVLSAMILGGFEGRVQAKFQDAAAQNRREKKDDKNDEKKDGKKGLTLKPTRKIEFTTDEGTWLSLDVSPDGKWIAFISDREGSENVWIMHPDGSGVKQVSKDPNNEFASPSWSPDGKYIFVSKAGFGITAYEIWMYHVDGGAGIQVTKAKATPTTPRRERGNAIGVVASPDGKFLYYAKRNGGFEYNAQFPLWQVARMDRKTGDEDVLLQSPASSFRPVLSPDGTELLY